MISGVERKFKWLLSRNYYSMKSYATTSLFRAPGNGGIIPTSRATTVAKHGVDA